MKPHFVFLALALATVSCSERHASTEVAETIPESLTSMESVPLDIWTEVSNDYPAVVAAVKWAGGSPDSIVSARVKVTSNLEYFETTRRNDEEIITEKIARHRWKVVKVPDETSELGSIAPNLYGNDYQLLERRIDRAPSRSAKDEQADASKPDPVAS